MKLKAAAFAVLALLAWAGGWAQDYPARQVMVVVPFSGGSASDVMTRIVLDRMNANFGQRIVVDNRPAAGGNVGTAQVAKAAADGYTLLMSASGPLAANKTLYPNLGYDPERDLQPISLFASLPNIVVVSAKLPVSTLPELVDYLRKNPKVSYGSVGVGSSQHLSGVYFEQLIGAQMLHIPYRVTANLVTELVSGQVPLGFQLLPNVLGQLKAGQVRALAVAAEKRLTALPDVPTAAEAGIKGYVSSAWFAFLGPRGTPRPIVDKVYKDVAVAIADPLVRNRFIEFGAEPLATTPEELARHISSEIVKWREIITKAGITLEQ